MAGDFGGSSSGSLNSESGSFSGGNSSRVLLGHGRARAASSVVLHIDDLFSTLLSLSFAGNAQASAPDGRRDGVDDGGWGAWAARLREVAPDSQPSFNALSSSFTSSSLTGSAVPPLHPQRVTSAGALAGASTSAGRSNTPPLLAPGLVLGSGPDEPKPRGHHEVRWHEFGSHSVAVQKGRFKLVASLALHGEPYVLSLSITASRPR
jgi:hypothetical protein